MSYLHFTKVGKDLGHDPRVRLQAAIDHTNAYFKHASYCVISGDMVNRGTIDDYKALYRNLGNLKIPFLPMIVNHNDRSIFRSVLPLRDGCMRNVIQYSVSALGCLFVCLDTQKSGTDGGEFCIERSAWLRSILNNGGESKVYLFMRHPPMELG